MIQAGSILVLSITTSTTTLDAPSILQQVSAILSRDGRISVQKNSIADSGITIMGVLDLGMGQPFQCTMQVSTSMDWTNQDDPLSVVENAFYQVTENYPTSATTVSVAAPPGYVVVNTAEGAQAATGPGGTDTGTKPVKSISDTIAEFFSGLKSTATSLLIGLAAILIIVLVLIAYGPNVGSVARAARP